VGKSGVLEHKSGNIPETRKDRLKSYYRGPIGNNQRCFVRYHPRFRTASPSPWIVDEIIKRLSIRAWHLFIAAQWRHRLGSKENRYFYELHLTPPVFYPILGVFPLHHTAPVGVRESRDPRFMCSWPRPIQP